MAIVFPLVICVEPIMLMEIASLAMLDILLLMEPVN